MNEKPKILIADDSEINRALLKEILGDGYDYLEAEDGAAAVELMRQRTDISLLLLDLMMPGMDGFDVLRVMKYHTWLDEIPVIVISAAEDTANIERAYDLGVADYIRRPFERIMILRRVKNILMLYAKQKRLTRLVTDQVYEKEHNSVLMISILSHVVEFRNSESGLHVLHIRTLTDLLLHQLAGKTDRYQLDESDISLISTASALHDLGKIVIPTEILNKPGRLTAEEYAMIKTHTVKGARILRDLGENPNRDFEKILAGLVPHSMVPVILERLEIPAGLKANSVTKAQRRALEELLKGFTVSVTGPRPVAEAIVTSGGVKVNQVQPSTMESKLTPGLYFAGEILDVDAYPGGFNLQIAWSTGHLAGTSAAVAEGE